MKKKLILINPIDYSFKNIMKSSGRKYPPLGLGIIAALTPEHWNIEIIDECFTEFVYKPADLVGITSFTCNVARAYKIASLYRQKGIHTVIGGIHASVLPEEAANYVDTVVIGEAENIWPKLISDFENDRISKQYRSEEFHTLLNLPKPRRDLFDKRYPQSIIQTSRGCPIHCDFCCIPAFSGKKTRYRPVNEVLDELETIEQQNIFFADDNFFGSGEANIARSKELFEGMIKRKINKNWYSYAGVNCAENNEVLKLAAKSGCKIIIIGIEADDNEALESSGKYVNLKHLQDNYKQLLKKIHKHDIGVMAGLMYGFDSDNKQKLDRRTLFATKSSIDMFHVSTLTPFPGTFFYNRLKKEKRLIYEETPENWKKYNLKEMVFLPKQISKEEFDIFMNKTHQKLYNKKFLKLRYIKTLLATGSFKTAKNTYEGNLETAFSYNCI